MIYNSGLGLILISSFREVGNSNLILLEKWVAPISIVILLGKIEKV